MAYRRPWLSPLSIVSGVEWPAVVDPAVAPLAGLLYQLEETQWWSPEDLLERQMLQLRLVLAHAARQTRFYRRRLAEAGFTSADVTPEGLRRLPVLTRRDLQRRFDDIKAARLPANHGRARTSQTSGSTGEPVRVGATDLTGLMWQAFSVRDYAWHRRDITGTSLAIRPTVTTEDPAAAEPRVGWPAPMGTLFPTGAAAALSIRTTVDQQAAWLARHRPDYLVALPSSVLALAEHFAATESARPALPGLRQIQTVSETVTPALRRACREVFGVEIADIYTTQEFGYVAIQCPEHEHYHVQAENVYLEVLDEAGAPCRPGEVGRLVITSLNNFFTPLIRYQIGDYAEVGEPCPCGRGLPVLRRILGRERNMLVLPDGRRKWPLTGYRAFHEAAPVRQFQMVQLSLEEIELRVVMDEPLTAAQGQALAAIVRSSLGHPFEVKVRQQAAIPRLPSGKFEEFYSLVDRQRA